MRSVLRTAFLLVSLAGIGCVSAEGVTRRAVPAAIDSSVNYLEDPEAQKKIVRLMEDPQIREAAHDLTAALVGGALDGATEEERQARLREVTGQFIDTVAAAAARNLREDISPAMSQAAAASVQRVLSTAMSPKSREQAAAMVDAVTRSAITAMTESTGRGLRDDIGPAMAKVIRADITPAMREAVTSDLLPVVFLMSREMSRGLVVGAAEGFRELDVEHKLGAYEGSVWTRLDMLLHKGIKLSQIVAWGLGFLVLIFGVLFGRAVLLRRRIEAERARSERILLGLMQGLQQGSDKPDVEHLLADLRAQHPDLADEDYFKELSRRASIRQSSFGRPRRRL